MTIQLSGAAFGLLVLFAYRWLEAPWAPWAVGVLGSLHLIVSGKSGPAQPKGLVLTHSFIVLATVASVILHARETVGFARGWAEILTSFAVGEAGRLAHLRHLAAAALVPVAVAAAIFGVGRQFRLRFGSSFFFLYVVGVLGRSWRLRVGVRLVPPSLFAGDPVDLLEGPS